MEAPAVGRSKALAAKAGGERAFSPEEGQQEGGVEGKAEKTWQRRKKGRSAVDFSFQHCININKRMHCCYCMSMNPEKNKNIRLLSCVDNSILKLDFGHNFYVEALDAYKGLNLLEELGPFSNRSFLKVELDRLNCIDQSSGSSKIFVVENHFETIKEAEKEVDSYLSPLFKIMRLFRWWINMPFLYYSRNETITNFNACSFIRNIYYQYRKIYNRFVKILLSVKIVRQNNMI